MDSFFDNKLVQMAIVGLACYILFKMVASNGSSLKENMDDVLGAQAGDSAVATTSSPVIITTPQTPVLTVTPNQQVLVQQPLDEHLIPPPSQPSAAAADVVSPDGSTGDMQYAPVTDDDMKSVMGVDTERMFLRPDEQKLITQNLVPKLDKDVDLFSQFKPDAKYDQAFLQNRFSAGIDASTTSRHYVNDMRGGLPVPFATAESFNNPTQFPDLYRKGLGDV